MLHVLHFFFYFVHCHILPLKQPEYTYVCSFIGHVFTCLNIQILNKEVQ
jgi:hypothetical protein